MAIVAQTPEELLAAAKARIEGFKSQSSQSYDEAIANTKAYAADTAVGGGKSFIDWFNELNDNAANMGINFAQGDLGADFLANQDYLSQIANGALSTDLAYFEKMRVLQQDLYNQMLQEMANNQALMVNGGGVGGSGGGGGGGRSNSGGGGSSSKSDAKFDPETGARVGDYSFTDTARETSKQYTPEFWDNFGYLTEQQQAIAINSLNRAGSGGVVGSNQNLQDMYNNGVAMENLLASGWTLPEDSNTSEALLWQQGMRDLEALKDIATVIEYTQDFNPNFAPTVTLRQTDQVGKFAWKDDDVADPSFVAPPTPEALQMAAKVGDIVRAAITANGFTGDNDPRPSQPSQEVQRQLPGRGDLDPRPKESYSFSGNTPTPAMNGLNSIQDIIKKAVAYNNDQQAMGPVVDPVYGYDPSRDNRSSSTMVDQSINGALKEAALARFRNKNTSNVAITDSVEAPKISDPNKPFGMTTRDEDYPLTPKALAGKQSVNMYGGVPLSQGAITGNNFGMEDTTSILSRNLSQAQADKAMRDKQAAIQAAAASSYQSGSVKPKAKPAVPARVVAPTNQSEQQIRYGGSLPGIPYQIAKPKEPGKRNPARVR